MPKVVKETSEKAVTKKVAAPKVAEKKAPAKTKSVGLSVPVYSLSGTAAGNLDLPKEVFGAKVNDNLLAQAIRVYTNNQKGHWSNTKTRGEVSGTTKKVYKQKHTGGARHGSKKAPIYVGGGIALGPKARKVVLELPKKMKKAALISALSQRAAQEAVFGLSGLDKATGKTKEMAVLMSKLGKKSTLVIGDKSTDQVVRAIRNLPRVDFLEAGQVNVFEVINHQSILLTKEAVERLQDKVTKKAEVKKETK